MFSNVDENHPYYELAKVFNEAFIQASAGKGSERHSYSAAENYKDQLVCEMDRRLDGNACGPRYQAVKKIYESARMDPEKAIHELLGAINYIAAAIILLKEKQEKTVGTKPYRIVESVSIPTVWWGERDQPDNRVIYYSKNKHTTQDGDESTEQE